MKTSVLVRGPARFDMCGRALPYQLKETGSAISKQLSNRLYRYALQALQESGFHKAVSDWDIEVYTIDGDSLINDRTYCVKWINSDGGYIEVIGIFIMNGKPFVDHGFAIGSE